MDKITRQHHVIDMMLDVRVGDTISFTVMRGDAPVDVSITITESLLTAY